MTHTITKWTGLALLLAVLFAGTSLALAATKVSPSDMMDWFFFAEGGATADGGFEVGPDSAPLGCSRNVSSTGIFVETTKRPPLESLHTLWFVWGEDIVSTSARVVRHAEDGIAFTFEAPNEALQRILADITAEAF